MRKVAVVATVLLVGVAVLGVPAAAQQPAGEQLLLFQRPGTLVTANANGSQQTVIAPPDAETGAGAQAPVWSPDGSLVAYMLSGSESQPSVRIVNASGTEDRLVMAGGVAVDWSPDGERLVVSVLGEGLFIVNRDGSNPHQITTVPEGGPGEFVDGQPRWSHDGTRIAFTRFDRLAGLPRHELLLVDADGGNLQQIMPGEAEIRSLDWAPDGSGLVFHRQLHEPEPRASDIFAVNHDGTNLRQLTHTEEAFWPAWSPDSRALALTVGYPGTDPPDLYLMDADGGNLRLVASHPSDFRHPSWSPDGARIAVTGSQCCREQEPNGPTPPRIAHDIYIAEVDGGAVTQITDDGVSEEPLFAPSPPVAFVVTDRVAGADRYATAAALSGTTYDRTDTVVLARGDDYADALAAAPLAGSLDAPVLLSRPQQLSAAAAAEIRRLGATTAYLMGGGNALSAQVERDVQQAGVTDIQRLAGADRFETAGMAAAELGAAHAYVVEGAHEDPARGWPDAVAVSGLAAHGQAPILLVTRDRLPEATRAAVQTQGIRRATVIGGTAAVGEGVADELRGEGLDVERLSGPDRYATSRAVAERSAAVGLRSERTWLATGRAFADALAGGPTAAADTGVLLLVDGQNAGGSPDALAWLDARSGTFERITLIGGQAAISDTARQQVEQAAR